MIGATINCDKSIGLPLGMWKGVSLPEHFLWTDGMVKTFSVWFGLDLLEMNWSEVLEKVEAALHLQSWRILFLMGKWKYVFCTSTQISLTDSLYFHSLNNNEVNDNGLKKRKKKY